MSLGDHDKAIREIALAVDRMGGAVAALTAYVAHLPGAAEVNLGEVTSLAHKLRPRPASSSNHLLLSEETARIASQIQALAAQLKSRQSGQKETPKGE